MSRAKTITKRAMDDPELQDLFNQMVGASDPDPKIIAPKYESLWADTKAILGLFEATFCNAQNVPAAIAEEFNKVFGEVKQFVVDGTAELATYTIVRQRGILASKSMQEINANPKLLQEYLMSMDNGYDAKQLGDVYKNLKDCKTLERIIVCVKDIRVCVEKDKTHFKKKIHDLEVRESLSKSFIESYDDDYLQLMPSICALDFKQLWLHPLMPNSMFERRVIFALHLALKRGTSIVQTIMSPDIDVERFSSILIENIDKVRKHLPRCDKAFNKIKQSVNLLKNNFGGYYKDFVTSKNPGIIVENFVLDVAEDSKADPETTRQFRRIVQFYQEKMRGQVKDPKIQKIFDLVGENLNLLEKKTGTSHNPTKTESEKPDSDSDSSESDA